MSSISSSTENFLYMWCIYMCVFIPQPSKHPVFTCCISLMLLCWNRPFCVVSPIRLLRIGCPLWLPVISSVLRAPQEDLAELAGEQRASRMKRAVASGWERTCFYHKPQPLSDLGNASDCSCRWAFIPTAMQFFDIIVYGSNLPLNSSRLMHHWIYMHTFCKCNSPLFFIYFFCL